MINSVVLYLQLGHRDIQYVDAKLDLSYCSTTHVYDSRIVGVVVSVTRARNYHLVFLARTDERSSQAGENL